MVPQDPPVLEKVVAKETQVVLTRLRCRTCGYGASVRATPPRCPMCGEHAWELDPRPAGVTL